jgi:alkylhydroperoxidase family enzyme
MSAEDLEELRGLGLSEAAIHDAIQVVSYFNYINRVADAIRVDPEPGMPPYPG